jgi:hypothetical protein
MRRAADVEIAENFRGSFATEASDSAEPSTPPATEAASN